MSTLSGNKDTDYLILKNMDDETLLNYCVSDKYANQICKNEQFWKERFYKNYLNNPDISDKVKNVIQKIVVENLKVGEQNT